jgi:carbon-monoxide dehydrogenase large subunit
VDDIAYPGMVHMAVVRSRYGHARVASVDASAAEEMDGVVGVFTREHLLEDGLSGEMPGGETDDSVDVERPLLVGDVARFQGDAVAVVVAEERRLAHDAASAVEVDAERLDAVPGLETARGPDAPAVHESVPDNVALEYETGDAGATAAALEAAETVVHLDVELNRVAAVPMETRGAVARYRASTGDLDVDLSCQKVLDEQDRFADVLGLPEHRVSVRTPAVGGGFGVKAQSYAAHYLTAWCAMRLGRPVKWVASRTESFTTTNHARRHSLTARAGVDGDGRITALHVESTADIGAYITEYGANVPAGNLGTRLLGQYDIPAAHFEVTGVFTNTTPVSAYRGAGRPEAAYVIERLASACARELGEDPTAFRRRNFIRPEQFPYETPFGSRYDSGDYERTLDAALEAVDYGEWRKRQQEAREEGRYLGVGVSTYIEICGGNAGSIQGGHVRMLPSGVVRATSSMGENGQGHATGFAQVVADELGVPYDDVEVVEGDTDHAPEGGGTGGSKAMAMGGNALKVSAERVRERARRVAAHELEADPADVTFDDGTFAVVGAPSRSLTIREVAARAYSGDLPEELRGLEETAFFSPEGSTAPFGTHVCVVSVDPETGGVDVERFVAVDDVGTQVNPKLVEGQIVGGVVNSLGQAFREEVRFDENATNVTGSLQDYAVPRAGDVPDIEWDSTVTPSPNNPLGVKGVGEAGTIGAMPAFVNAVVDALEPFGVEALDMPLSDERVYRAIHGDEE